jgi:long-chain fatty acid transport protein
MKLLYGCIAGLFLLAGSAAGAGFQLYTEGSAEALGQAGAVSGRDDLVSLAWYNPAALAGTERPAMLTGCSFVQLQTDFSGAAGRASMADDWRAIPHLYYAQPLAEDWTGLLSINAPYGLVSEWSERWLGNLAATYSSFSAVYTTPSLAYRFNDRISVSAGFNVVYADAELAADRVAFGERTVKGGDAGYGGTVAAHANLARNWSVGVRYQSRVALKLDGDVYFDSNPLSPGDTVFSGRTEIILPSSVNLGLANRTFAGLKLGIDLVWTEWSTYDQLVFNFSSDYPALLSNPEGAPKQWDDAWSVRVGGEYELCESWGLRGGYVWDQSPVPDATRSPELPGSDRQMLMAGIGWSGEKLSLDLAYSYLWAATAESGSEIVSQIPALAGSYDTATHVCAFSVGVAF